MERFIGMTTQSMHTESVLLGFKGGPKGILHNEHVQLDRAAVNTVRNVGGFHLLGTGRDKIESPADLEVKPYGNSATRLHAPFIGCDDDTMLTIPEPYQSTKAEARCTREDISRPLRARVVLVFQPS